MSHKAILALRNDIQEDEYTRWYANQADGEGVVITYAFLTTAPGPEEGLYPGATETFSTYNTQEKAVVVAALRHFSSFANIRFVEASPDQALLTFGQYDHPGTIDGSSYKIFYDKKLGSYDPGAVWIDTQQDFRSNGGAIETILHEVGHTLGLKHPFQGTYKLSGKELASSIMGYTYDGPYNKVGVFDIMALQSIYGPAQARLGSNTYKFGKDKLIWDGGGIDTIDASAAKSKIFLDLNDGTWNYIGKKASSLLSADQVYIGEFTVIENAKGSKYADKIYGNDVRNVIKGGAGNDVIDGRSGNDALYGDAGNDKLYGGYGDDKLYGGAGNDLLSGGSGMDFLSGGAGDDIIQGGAGADRLYGGSGKVKFKFNGYGDLGDLVSFDRIFDFRKDDKIDFKAFDANPEVAGRQKMTFLGNSTGDWKLNAGKAGQFYYNTASDRLVIDANGDGVADHYIGVKGITSMKADYFLL